MSNTNIAPVFRPVAKLVGESLTEKSEIIDRAGGSLDFSFPFPQDEHSSSKSSGDNRYRKYTENKHIKRVKLEYAPIKTNERKIASSEEEIYSRHLEVI